MELQPQEQVVPVKEVSSAQQPLKVMKVLMEQVLIQLNLAFMPQLVLLCKLCAHLVPIQMLLKKKRVIHAKLANIAILLK